MRRFKNILCILARRHDQHRVLARCVALGESNQAKLRLVTVAENI